MPEIYHLPDPISTNELWVPNGSGKGIVLSPKYRAWKKAAEQELRLVQRAHKRPVKGKCRADVLIPEGWRGDIDNAVKASFDALQEADVIANDKDIRELRVKYQGNRLVVVLTKIGVEMPKKGKVT